MPSLQKISAVVVMVRAVGIRYLVVFAVDAARSTTFSLPHYFRRILGSLRVPFCRWIPRNCEHRFAEQEEPAKCSVLQYICIPAPTTASLVHTTKPAPRILSHPVNGNTSTPFTSGFSDLNRQLAFVGVAGAFRDRDLGDKRSAVTTCHSLGRSACCSRRFFVEKVRRSDHGQTCFSVWQLCRNPSFKPSRTRNLPPKLSPFKGTSSKWFFSCRLFVGSPAARANLQGIYSFASA